MYRLAAFPEDEPREEGGEKNQPRQHSFLSCLSFPEGEEEREKLSRQYSFVLLYCQLSAALSAAAAAATCAVPHTVVHVCILYHEI